MSSGSYEPVTLGIDLGTSAVKVVALGPGVRVIGDSASVFQTVATLPQQAEQNPSDWLRAVSIAMSQLRQSLPRVLGENWAERVDAIGLTGQLPSLVCLGADGPLGRAIIWKDGRADEWTAERVDADLRRRMYELTGMPIDGRYLAPMLRYHFADRLGDLHGILSAKDYLLLALTGVRATEPSTAAGYGIYDLHDRCFSEELRRFWQIPAGLLPPIHAANSLAGRLHAAGARLLGLPAGIAVSIGAADSVCAAYAMSGLDPGIVSVSFGSSAVIIGAVAQPRLDPGCRYLLTPHVAADWFGREMDLLATGTGYRWLADLFGWQEGAVDRHAAASVPGARGLTLTPYLAGGEQGALWNPKLRGAIFGLSVQHSTSDIARAFLEGVFFEIRRCVDVLAETAGVERVMVSGNTARSQSSLQLCADVLQRPVGAVTERSPAALGAALLARNMTGGIRGAGALARTEMAPVQPKSHVYGPLYAQYLRQAALCGDH